MLSSKITHKDHNKGHKKNLKENNMKVALIYIEIISLIPTLEMYDGML